MGIRERNYGIDLLRIVSMYFILILHMLGKGGVLENVVLFSLNWHFIWLIEIVAYAAVNCYALISGYVGYESKHKYASIMYLYLQMVFYALIVAVIFLFIYPEAVGVMDVFKAFFPVFLGGNWYLSSYFVCFFLMPFMNILISNLDKGQSKRLLLIIFLFFSFIPTVLMKDIYILSDGYSPIWLLLLYIIGGCIKKHNLCAEIKNIKLIVGYCLMIIITYLSKFLLEYVVVGKLDIIDDGNVFIKYTSPTILMCSIILLVLFERMSIKGWIKRMITFFAPLAFGVFLIHRAPQIWEHLFTNKFVELSTCNSFFMVVAILFGALLIWFICSLIDYVRLCIFNKLKIKEFCCNVEKFCGKIVRLKCY